MRPPGDNVRRPNLEDQVVELFDRVEDLEKRGTPADPVDGPQPKYLPISKPGILREGQATTPFTHPEGAFLTSIRWRLRTPGSLDFRIIVAVNGWEVKPDNVAAGTFPRIVAGQTVAEWYYSNLYLGPDAGELLCEIGEPTGGAAGLTGLLTFGR